MKLQGLYSKNNMGSIACLGLMLLVGITAGGLGSTSVAASQSRFERAPAQVEEFPTLISASPEAPPREAVRLAFAEARLAYLQAERWVQRGELDDSAQSPLWVADVSGVRIDLRWSVGGHPGLHMGSGQAITAPEVGDVVNLMALVREATTEAMRQMNRRYQRAAEAGERRLSLEDIGARMLVELQIARKPTPISFQGPAELRRITETWAPGYHGIAMERRRPDGGTLKSRVWPASALSMNRSAEFQLFSLFNDMEFDIVTASGRREALDSLLKPGGPQLQRFEVIHVVRPGMHLPVTQLVRGNAPIPAAEIMADSPTLTSMAGRMVEHLRKRQREDGRMAGTFEPSLDNLPSPASPEEAAMMIYAMAARLEWMARYDPDPTQLRQTRQAIRRYLDAFRTDFTAQRDRMDPATAAWCLLALSVTTELAERRDLRDQLADYLASLITPDGRFVPKVPDQAREGTELRDSVSALLAAALTMHAAISGDAESTDAATIARARLWTRVWPDATFGRRVEMLPWLALLEREAANVPKLARQSIRVPIETGENDSTSYSRPAPEMTRTIERLLRLQVTEPPALGPHDVVGGLVLAEAAWTDHAPNPDWRTSYLVLSAAILLQTPDAVELGRRTPWLIAAASGAGFLGQLMFDEQNCFYIRNRDNSLGGIRLSLVDNRLAPGPAAMSLLATTELQEAVRQRQERGR
ncbi:MAG: hypothetical protein JJU36_15815 [Phycisphaeraceae bacterium]|nr:hypothetical protein [Phycisphaeraceae bacterium]